MTAAEILVESGIRELPVNLSAIAERFGVKFVSYTDFSDSFEVSRRELYEYSKCGFGMITNERYVCVINENACGEQRKRWTMAHELAHFFLEHIKDRQSGVSERSAKDEILADRLAAELLAPLVALHFCSVSSAAEISHLCGISAQAAQIRYKELCRCRKAVSNRSRGMNGGSDAELISLDSEDNLTLLRQLSPFVGKYIYERAAHDGYANYIEKRRSDRLLAEYSEPTF
jgi:Zn-dependent peptidase ImmA (M78 family)